MLSSLALGSFLSHETLDYKSEFVLSWGFPRRPFCIPTHVAHSQPLTS